MGATQSVLPSNTIEISYKTSYVQATGGIFSKVSKTYSTTELFKEAELQLEKSPKEFMNNTFAIKEHNISEITSIKCVGETNYNDSLLDSIGPL